MFTVDLKKVFNNQKICIDECELEPCNLIDHIPAADENYVFELNVLNEILLYLIYPFKDCLYISGPSGCGKTTIVLQVASRLNWGVEQITLSNKCESLDLIGHTTLKKGELVYEYGPLTRAMLYGEILILNEIDLMSPGDLSVLNDVLEGKPLTILANNGEIIKPHPQFRVIATANTKGYGDMTGFYNGARLLNQAFLDRFRYIEMNYPKAVVELEMLRSSFPTLDDDLRKKLIHLAHDLRQVVALGIENGVRQISAPFSTRALLKIASLLSVQSTYSVHNVVRMCYSLRLPEVESEYVMRLCNDIFGHEKGVLKKTQKNDLNESTADFNLENEKEDTTKKAVRSRRRTKNKTLEEKTA
ncbi:MAG: AAA family ATPase [Succinivibrio sp.]